MIAAAPSFVTRARSGAGSWPCEDRRASSVRNYLVEKEGLGEVDFTTSGLGAKKPVAPNTRPDGSDDPDGRQKNRRVEIVIGK